MIDRQDIIQAQLQHDQPFSYDVGEGKTTLCKPVRLVPPVAGDTSAVSLNGTWTCTRWPFAEDEDALAAPACDDSDWEQVEQPGKVFYYDPEEDGHAKDNWNRVTLEHIDDDDGAVIRRTITVPAAWGGKRILLRFNAIFPAGIVYLNGEKLGEQMSGLTPIEWDVTDRVTPGEEALVAVRLCRKHRWVQLDMVRHACEFTGLAQDACLHAVDPCHIADYHLVSNLDDDFETGSLEGQVFIRNAGTTDQRVTLTVGIADADEAETVTVPADSTVPVDVNIELDDIDPWSDEDPNLYDVTLALTGEDASVQEVAYRTGFRRFVCADGRAMLNGKPVKFRGVNHLTFHPEFGMYTPEPWLRQCLELMKKANVNAIRTHFLGPPALADLCDELGIYFLQELPIDWGHTYLWNPEVVGPVLTRLDGGVRRDRHHPSIMVWSVGNENLPRNMEEHEDFFNHLHLFDEFVKTLDPTRYTMFPPPGPANKIRGIFETRVGDIADTHYSFNLVRDFNETDKLLTPKTWEAQFEETTREEAMAQGWSGVWFSSEYGIYNHIPDIIFGPYGSIINDKPDDPLSGEASITAFYRRLEREWGYMREDPTCLGGAYFPWLCSGGGDNPWGWVRWGEDADWGVVTADLLPKPAFWALRVLFSPVWFPKKLDWKPGQKELRFTMRNTFNSIDFADCTLRTQMAGGGKYMGQMRTWQDVPISGAPGETVDVVIPIWNERTLETLEQGGPVICRCHFLQPDGFRAVTWDIMVTPPEAAEVEEAMPVGPDAVL